MNLFRHGGATGDIIFSLPVVKELGGGDFYITMADQQRSESVKKLLQVQPYINSVHIGEPPTYTHNLDKFRDVFTGAHDNIVEAHFRSQGVTPPSNWKEGWLSLPESDLPFEGLGEYCVINRTDRYNDPNCNWTAEIEYLYGIAPFVYFIGYKDEYHRFVNQYGFVDYMDLDFLQGAYLLQSAKMFSGNYSAWATVAQGLGIPYRLEQAPGHTCSTLFIERETIINA